MNKALSVIAAMLLIGACVTGCAGLGKRVEHGEKGELSQAQPLPTGEDGTVPISRIPEDAPDVDVILKDLADNDAKVVNFRAAAHFTLQSPEVEGIQKFRSGSYIAYRRPSDLCVVGRLRTGNVAFQLTCVGDEFLVEFPMERDPEKRYYYQFGGEQFESVPFSVSPSDVARELFFPEEWAKLGRREARIIGYEQGVATMTVGSRRHPRRVLDVGQLEDGHWVVLKSELLDDDGGIVALTTRNTYHEVDGYRFPTAVDVEFPGEQARISFELQNIRINTDLVNDSTFTFDWRPSNATRSH